MGPIIIPIIQLKKLRLTGELHLQVRAGIETQICLGLARILNHLFNEETSSEREGVLATITQQVAGIQT